MKVLVTGSLGFIGKNLCEHLKSRNDIELIEFDKDDEFSVLEENIKSIDFIFHLAGINRSTDNKEFYEGNTDLTKSIIELIKKENISVPFLITSSIQAAKDNDYGKSKKLAEEALFEYSKETGNPVFVFRLHNVFGKWCKPNYNSVVATFCHNLSHDLDITVNDENSELELIYIDDVCEEFLSILDGNDPKKKSGEYYNIKLSYKLTLGDLTNRLKKIKTNMETILVPETGDLFTKKLFSTYLSYVELPDLVIQPVMHKDDRGSFTELIHTDNSGQVSVSVSKPGVFRGNHYHHTKMEKFIVIKGEAKITFEHIITGEMHQYEVDDKELKIVNIPVGYTHKIENTGDDDMILILWCNELLDNSKPDTYFREVGVYERKTLSFNSYTSL